MSYEMDIRCYMWGNSFSPKKIEKMTELKLEQKLEVGDLITKGVLKNQFSLMGSASLVASNGQCDLVDTKLDDFIELLYSNFEILRTSGAENFDLSIGVFYHDQCNLSFSPHIMERIGKMGIDFNISCYEVRNRKLD